MICLLYKKTMCGIIGVMTSKSVKDLLIEGLFRLEYRGYDSSGMAICKKDEILSYRAVGKVVGLKKIIDGLGEDIFDGANIGIAHTRWATHGITSVENAHPQSDGNVAVVHNGIIENYSELKELVPEAKFESKTDTEVIVHLITKEIKQGSSFLDAVIRTIKLLRGTFAIAVIEKNNPDSLIVAKRLSPLCVGCLSVGNKFEDVFITSDLASISNWINKSVDLGDNEICMIKKEKESIGCHFFDSEGRKIEKKFVDSLNLEISRDKGRFADFTIKEIHDQPIVLGHIVEDLKNKGLFNGVGLEIFEHGINFLGCGSSYYASLVGKYFVEKFCGLRTTAEIASEFRYRSPVLMKREISVCISQSGETIDTIEALKYVQEHGGKVLVLTNVLHSNMAKRADFILPLNAGVELSVVSTKAFTAQLMMICCFVIEYLNFNDHKGEANLLMLDMENIPSLIKKVLGNLDLFDEASVILSKAKSVLFLGRGACYPIAMECALKLKETSYIHSDGYPCGEMKHGTIALIEKGVISVIIAPFDQLFEKTISNLQEIISREGRIILLTDEKGADYVDKQKLDESLIHKLIVPDTGEMSKLFVYSVAGQIIAYKTAVLKGLDVDRPRNLAKAVTVE